MVERKTLSLAIGGREYTLITDEYEEYVVRAARMVESEIQDASGHVSVAPQTREAVFVALKLATDLIKFQEEHRLLEKKVAALLDLVSEHDL